MNMFAEHIKVFAEIYLEDKSFIDSKSFKEFMFKEVQLPVTHPEILDALAEMCTEKRLKLLSVSNGYARYKKQV
jgi:hypothetical protein